MFPASEATADLTSATSLTESGLRFGSDARSLTLVPHVQLDAGAASGSLGGRDVNAMHERVEVRRARLTAIYRAGSIGAVLVPDVAPAGAPRLIAAYLDYTPRERVTLRLGQQTPPLSLSFLTSSRFLTFAERSASAALHPGLAVGLSGSVSGNRFVVGGGVYGGDLNDDPAAEGTAVAFHISGAPPPFDPASLHVGLGLYARNLSGARTTPSFAGSAGSALVQAATLTAAPLDDARAVYGANVELARTFGRVSLQGELTALRVDRRGDDATLVGGYAFATITLTGEARPYRVEASDFERLVPGAPLGRGGAGAWELGLRADALDLGAAAAPGSGSVQRGLHAVLNWYATRRWRVLLDAGVERVRGNGRSDAVRTVTFRLQYAY